MADVLLIEDDPVAAAIAQEMVSRLGLTCQISSNGTEGFKAFSLLPARIVLCDIHLPGIDGFATTRKIRKLIEDNHLRSKIIMLSSRGDKTDIQMAVANGAHDYVVKPLTSQVLQVKIQRSLE